MGAAACECRPVCTAELYTHTPTPTLLSFPSFPFWDQHCGTVIQVLEASSTVPCSIDVVEWTESVCVCAVESPQQLVHLTAGGFSWEKERHSQGSAVLSHVVLVSCQDTLRAVSDTRYLFFSKQFSNVSIPKKPQANPKIQMLAFLKMLAKLPRKEDGLSQMLLYLL